MTAMRSQIWAATRRSWVMNSIGEVEAALHVVEEVEHLRLHRDVEGRDGLVGDQHLRLHGERAGDGDALALAAGELVRVAVERVGREADEAPSASGRARAPRRAGGRN